MGARFGPRGEEGSDPVSTPLDAAEQRKLRSVARRYERDGYRVTVPGRGGGLPAFLQGLTPDLIAESERDRVVIEVKRSDAVRGSNDLVELAERVSREPGWRFELVTVRSDGQARAEAPSAEFTAADLADYVEGRARELMGAGRTDVAYFFASAGLEAELLLRARRHGLKVAERLSMRALRDLVFKGIVSRDVFARLEKVFGARHLVLRRAIVEEVLPTIADVEDLLALLRHLDGKMAAATAA